MINISFDNAFLLLLAIPLLALILVPYFISINKDNRDGHVVASLALHLAIVLFATFALAGTTVTAIITQTSVYVVADVSYSSSRNLDKVDQYVNTVKRSLPSNSKMGVICFGKDYELNTELGGKFQTVTDSTVDDSATNIAEALNYASTLFEDGVIKRIVLITDGKNTAGADSAELIKTIEDLYLNDIYIDAMYLDNNVYQNVNEVQITSVDFNKSTYLNRKTTADVLLQTTNETPAYVTLYQNDTLIDWASVTLTQGFNVVNFDLPTDEWGTFDYTIKVDTLSDDGDVNDKNNAYGFTQKVAEKLNVLLITSNSADVAEAEALYGENANITSCIYDTKKEKFNTAVPFSIEQLCQYDEFLISETDIRVIENTGSFINNLDTAVAQFGKSLITFGNLSIQNRDDEHLEALGNMLPISYGNSDGDEKHVGIVIDSSYSMEQIFHFQMAQQAAIQIINLLDDGDTVSLVVFNGEVYIPYPKVTLNSPSDRDEIIEYVNSLECGQGTMINAGLSAAYQWLNTSDVEIKEVFLISDGYTYLGEDKNDIKSTVYSQYQQGVITSTIAIGGSSTPSTSDPDQGEAKALMDDIAANGFGRCYPAASQEELAEIMLSDFADDFEETEIENEKGIQLNVKKKTDDVLSEIDSENFPLIYGYMYGKAKSSATVVLTATYEKTDENGNTVYREPPIYSYWHYGNGTVSVFTSRLSGKWTTESASAIEWTKGYGATFFKNVLTTSTPNERIDYPYTLNVEYDGTYSTVEIIPAVLNLSAAASVTITSPNGEQTTEYLIFDGSRYYYSFETPLTGKYQLDINYSYSLLSYNATAYFNVSYSPEYDSFVVFDVSDVYKFIRHRGTVTTDGTVNLQNDGSKVATYTLKLTVPLLVIAVSLFVVDIVIRKLKWADIKSLFKRRKK